eukprot:9476127-Pyramimonas_sp.AAC.1
MEGQQFKRLLSLQRRAHSPRKTQCLQGWKGVVFRMQLSTQRCAHSSQKSSETWMERGGFQDVALGNTTRTLVLRCVTASGPEG